MKGQILDKIDLNILATLARDCRTSYSSIGSQIGLTSKSIKSRVKNMMQSGIIEKFIVIVNRHMNDYNKRIFGIYVYDHLKSLINIIIQPS